MNIWANLNDLFKQKGFDPSQLIGKKVRAVKETHGWGEVNFRDKGILVKIGWDGIAYAQFNDDHFHWKGKYECFEVLINESDEEDIL